MMLGIFFTSIFFLVYIFVLYPILVSIISQFSKKSYFSDTYEPTVSIIIAAYNEACVIEKKIKNTLALTYPAEKLEILVFSDGSTDDTDNIITQYAEKGVRLFRYEGRKGKTYCQNKTVAAAKGDILVFSDANSMYQKDAIGHLVYHFSDERVGGVCGELRYTDIKGKSSEGLYWKFEQFLKKKESSIDSCIGANGAIYAVRASAYEPLPEDVISDFVEPLVVYKKGYKILYEPNAIATEIVDVDVKQLARKKRIILRAMHGLFYTKELLFPIKYPAIAWFLWSHKVFRWMIFVWAIMLLIANVCLLDVHLIFWVTISMQLVGYTFAGIGLFVNWYPLQICTYIVQMIFAASWAFISFLFGKKKIVWEVAR